VSKWLKKAAVLVAVTTTLHSGLQAQKRRVAPYAGLVPEADLRAAMQETQSCLSSNTLSNSCQGSFRNLKWTLYTKKWSTEIVTPSGAVWIVQCTHDSIESEDRCRWTTGEHFSVSVGDGYSVYVGWGLRKFPGSEMIAKFDDRPPLRTTSEFWTQVQSRAIYRQMLTSKVLRYRWYTWPDEFARDGKIDLVAFKDVAALGEALRMDFVTARVLKMIEVDK
jgi:hypothetical protein